jgi:hypothetical protein
MIMCVCLLISSHHHMIWRNVCSLLAHRCGLRCWESVTCRARARVAVGRARRGGHGRRRPRRWIWWLRWTNECIDKPKEMSSSSSLLFFFFLNWIFDAKAPGGLIDDVYYVVLVRARNPTENSVTPRRIWWNTSGGLFVLVVYILDISRALKNI